MSDEITILILQCVAAITPILFGSGLLARQIWAVRAVAWLIRVAVERVTRDWVDPTKTINFEKGFRYDLYPDQERKAMDMAITEVQNNARIKDVTRIPIIGPSITAMVSDPKKLEPLIQKQVEAVKAEKVKKAKKRAADMRHRVAQTIRHGKAFR